MTAFDNDRWDAERKARLERVTMPFVCLHRDPRCDDDPCPWGIARTLCNAPADHPARLEMTK